MRKQMLRILLVFCMIFTMMPVSVFAEEADGLHEDHPEYAADCTCESDDPAFHAPFCSLYAAPDAPACLCVEQCAEGSVNEWCDVCYFDHAACAASGEEEAAVYEWLLYIYTPEDLMKYFTVTFDSYGLELCVGQEGRLPYTFEWNPDYNNNDKAFFVVPDPVSPYAEMVDPTSDQWTIRGLKAGEAQFTLQVDKVILSAPVGLANFTVKVYDHSYDNGFCTRCGGYEPAELVDDYYHIGNAGQMFWFANYINTVDNTASARLTADINLENRAWTPMGAEGGNASDGFRGTFDGNGKTISGLNVTAADHGVGFIGEVRNGTVKDFTICGEVELNGRYDYVGGVIGSACGTSNDVGATISGITSYVNVTLGEGSHGSNRVAGLVGYVNHNTNVENCAWYGTLDLGPYRAQDGVGGLVGKANTNYSGTIRNCGAYGTIKTSYQSGAYSNPSNGTPFDTIYIGGIVSNSLAGAQTKIENCIWAGTIVNNTNLGTKAHISSVGTLNGIESVTGCYVLNNTPYVTTNGAHDSYITSVTAEQLASGEVACKLGEAWGQILGTNHYPVPGGQKVYQIEYCDGLIYSNTDLVGGHRHDANGFCTSCNAYQPAEQDESGVYQIGNAGQLYWFAQLVDDGATDANAVLTADIVDNENVLNADGTLNGTPGREWSSIGEYVGTFDGQNHTISGLYINDSSIHYVGMFAMVSPYGKVQNVGVIDSYMCGNVYVGGVVAYNYAGTVTNCYYTGTVSGHSDVGGVVGNNCGTITGCYNTGTVNGYGDVGGVVGQSSGPIANCYNTGAVSGNSTVGGVIGYNNDTAANCYNTGTVSGNSYVGGVVGYNNADDVIENSYCNSDVYGGDPIGGGNGTATKVEGMTAEQFRSGEVAYLLGDAFGQDIGSEAYPVLGGTKVYGGYTSCDDVKDYSNDSAIAQEKPDHNWTNSDGICVSCGTACPHESYHDSKCTICGVECTEHNYTDGKCIVCGTACPHESYTNGFCTVCGGYEPAALAGDYHEISNTGQLYWFAKQVNSGNTAINGKLTANIVVNEKVLKADGTLNGDGSGFLPWTPMGNFKTRYTGTFDGSGKTISGLYVNGNTSYVGLFGNSSGTVKHVGVVDSYLSGDEYVGGVAGCKFGTVENCYNTGSVSGSCYVGGVVGYSTGYTSTGITNTVKSCYNSGSVCTSGSGSVSGCVGGVVGYNYNSTITGCYNTGAVSGGVCVGGVVGSNNGTAKHLGVVNCYNKGSVSGSMYVGGVAGDNCGVTIAGCYNAGKLSGSTDVGGVVGYNAVTGKGEYWGTVVNCYYDSDIYSGHAIGCDSGIATDVLGKTTADFASGAVTVSLSQGCTVDETAYSGDVWGQNIDGEGEKDAYPVLGGAKVYEGYTDCDDVKDYSNDSAIAQEKPDHDWSNSDGICVGCGTACKHESYHDGKCTICGAECEHPSDTDGICDFCGEKCPPAKITGLAITVDGLTYTEGNVIITPDSEIQIIVYGTNLTQGNPEAVINTPLTYIRLDSITRTENDMVSVVTQPSWFSGADNYPITYTNDGWVNTQVSGITVTYVQNTISAEITGLAITVDGMTYTEGNVIIKPDSEVQFIIYGTNLTQGNPAAVIDTPQVYVYLKNITCTENDVVSVATHPSWFSGADNYPITYTNDDWGNTLESGITVTYNDGTTEVPAFEIVKQPVSVTGTIGETVSVSVEATGEGLTYQWYIRNAGSSGWSVSSITSNTYETVMNKTRANRELYCVITDANGNTLKTDVVMLIGQPDEELMILTQPADASAKLGEDYCVEVIAQGDGLKYQWYFRNKGQTSWTSSSVKDNTYDDVMNSSRVGREVYCVITDAWGNSVTTETATLIGLPEVELAIVEQPADASAEIGEPFVVSVEAAGEGLRYTWYWRQIGAETWNISGQKDNTYDAEMTASRHNREVYCVITDAFGNTVSTDIATITGTPTRTLEITEQPESQTVTLGDAFHVSVEAQGDDIRYQWYFRKAGTENWTASSQKDNTYDDVMTAARHNRELYCVITDAWGNTVETSPAVLIMAVPAHELSIVTQPEDTSVKMGEEFCVALEAQGDGLKYQWFWRQVGAETWNTSGQRDNTYDDVMTRARHNREAYCVITDMWGESVETDVVTITAVPGEALEIIAQPTDAYAAMGENYCVTVEAQGDGLKYQWYFRNEGSNVWHKSGVADNTYDDVMNKSRAGREVYCVITDIWGDSVTTDTAILVCTDNTPEIPEN